MGYTILFYVYDAACFSQNPYLLPVFSDPVAYRIEPLLLPEGVGREEFPSPLFLTPDGKSVRLHVKARQGAEHIIKGLGSLSAIFDKSVENAAHAAAAADAEARKNADAAYTGSDEKEKTERSNFSGCIKGRECSFLLGGRSTRVDFQIQPGVIDNEYLSGEET